MTNESNELAVPEEFVINVVATTKVVEKNFLYLNSVAKFSSGSFFAFCSFISLSVFYLSSVL